MMGKWPSPSSIGMLSLGVLGVGFLVAVWFGSTPWSMDAGFGGEGDGHSWEGGGVRRVHVARANMTAIAAAGQPVVVEGVLRGPSATEGLRQLAAALGDSAFWKKQLGLQEVPFAAHAAKPYFTYHQSHRPLQVFPAVAALEDSAPRKDAIEAATLLRRLFPPVDSSSRGDGGGPSGEGALGGTGGGGEGDERRRRQERGEGDWRYVYVAEALHRLDPALDALVAQWTAPLQVCPEEGQQCTPQDMKLMLWIGTEGVTTRLHYDWSYNAHVVLRGGKTFTLFPPSQQLLLYLYPYLHPRATKSQVLVNHTAVTLEDVDARFSAYHSAKPLTITVHEGEALYIPPLWFHHVTTVKSTISLAAWSECAETVYMNEALAMGLPKLPDVPDAAATAASSSYVLALLDRVVGQVPAQPPVATLDGWEGGGGADGRGGEEDVATRSWSVRSFLWNLLASRYEPLYEAVPELQPQVLDGSCAAGPPLEEVLLHSSSPEEAATAQRHLDAVAALFLRVPFDRRVLWLMDWVEVVANHVVGADAVPQYLHCLVESIG